MNRTFTTAVATLAVAAAGALSGSALAHRGAHASAGTPLSFTAWEVDVIHHGTQKSYTSAPGATVRKCSTERLVELKAFYHASGSTRGKVHEIWTDGTAKAVFTSKHVYRNGYFFIYKTAGHLPSGKWHLKVVRHGNVIGRTSLTVRSKHC